MRVLVTGACGFIGSELVPEMIVRVPGAEILGLGPFPLEDLRSEDTLERVRRFDAQMVFHLAAQHFVPWCIAHPGDTLETNAVATAALLRACPSAETFVLASSAAVYGLGDARAHTEIDRLQAGDVYGLSKVWAEDALRAASDGRHFVAARLFNVVGQHDSTPHLMPLILAGARKGEPVRLNMAALNEIRDYIHVQDAARALVDLALLGGDRMRAVNVCTGRGYSVGEVAELFGVQLEDNPAARRAGGGDLVGDPRLLRDLTGFAPTDPMDRLMEGV